jgi:hypothetical protein
MRVLAESQRACTTRETGAEGMEMWTESRSLSHSAVLETVLLLPLPKVSSSIEGEGLKDGNGVINAGTLVREMVMDSTSSAAG